MGDWYRWGGNSAEDALIARLDARAARPPPPRRSVRVVWNPPQEPEPEQVAVAA